MGEERKSSIYALIDPRNGNVRYVGRSVAPVDRRHWHIHEAVKGTANSLKREWLTELHSLGLRPELQIIDEVPCSEERETEILWIKHYDRIDAPLTNATHSRKTRRVRLSVETKRQLDYLAAKWGETQTDAITRMIERTYQQETRTMTTQWHQMNWQQAVTIMANSSLYENDEEREQAAQRIMIDIDRQDDEGVWEWVMNGDWTGDETPESVTEELADLEAE